MEEKGVKGNERKKIKDEAVTATLSENEGGGSIGVK